MSFFRHVEIYRGGVAPIREGAAPKKYRPLPHPLDESPVGYSSASCSPAGLASASPTGSDFERKGFCRTINSQQTVNSALTTCLTAGAHPSPPACWLQGRHLRPQRLRKIRPADYG